MTTETMPYFFDTEFLEDGRTIELVSLGVCCGDGREFYAELAGVDWSKANPWVLANVRPHLQGKPVDRDDVRAGLLAFVGDEKPEFWADYASYDWVAVAQLFGTMQDLPAGWPMRVMDVQQLADHVAELTGWHPELPEPAVGHNALNDALNVRQRYMICRGALNEALDAGR